MQFPDPVLVDIGDANIATYEADGDPERRRPPILLIHGWPEIAFSWRNQIYALAETGYRAIAIDLKGFGRSDAPEDVALYDIEHLTNDLAALLDALDIERAVFCGHDWGGAIVWSMGRWRPDRVAGIIGVCAPLRSRPPAPPISIFKQLFTDQHYIVQFQEPDAPEELFSKDIEHFVRMIFQKPAPRERWAELIPQVYDLPGRFKQKIALNPENLLVTEEVLNVYFEAYKRSGFHGGINLYRNINRNWELMEGRDEIVRAPSLWIGAELDIFLPPESAEGMEALVPDLEKKIIEGSGHWVTWEKPDALNSMIIDWLNRKNFINL